MESKTSIFALYKLYIDAFMKGNPNLTRSTCHFNAQIEWNKIKHDEQLIRKSIEKYTTTVETGTTITTKQDNPNRNYIPIETTSIKNDRKRSLSSDDEIEPVHKDIEFEKVTPVEPTFSKRDAARSADYSDPSKPWVRRALERAQARIEARLAKIEARRKCRENRIKTPAQEAVLLELKEISERIESLMQVKNMGLSTAESNETLKKLMEQKKKRLATLRSLRAKQVAALNYRIRKKKTMETICAADPEVASQLMRVYIPHTIRAQIDNICPQLVETFEEIARICGAIDINPRLLNIVACASLDEIRDKIRPRGYEIRRTTNFYRLIPTGIFREDGKRHTTSTPVRLRKMQGIVPSVHDDCYFVNAIMSHIKDLAGAFGNDCVFYMIEDRKASIRIGRAESRGLAPLIPHLDYQVSSLNSKPLPNNVTQHLKPIVYASCIIDEAGLVTNYGPTYVSIRSTKYENFSNDHEDADLDYALKLREFERTARNHVGVIKPIIIMGVDSLNPQDYTRFPQTLMSAIGRFKKYNLDALIIFTQAPGQTSFDIAERRIAILSQDLTGLVLPHDYFGTHLNSHGFTIDAEVEKLNLKKAGEVLAEVWSMNKIDNFNVVAQYLDPPAEVDEVVQSVDVKLTLSRIIDLICDEEEDIPLDQRMKRIQSIPKITIESGSPKQSYDIDEYWCATHVVQTQYTIQIIRCTRLECCGPWRSNYAQVFPHRFLPPPVPFHRSSAGVKLADFESSIPSRNSKSPYYGNLFQRIQFHGIVIHETKCSLIPYDAFCPSIQSKLRSRVCSICKQYIPLPLRLRNHYRVHQQRYALTSKTVESKKEEEDVIDEAEPTEIHETPVNQINPAETSMFLFSDLNEWLKPDFEQLQVPQIKQKSVATIANEMIRKEKQAANIETSNDSQRPTTDSSTCSVSTRSINFTEEFEKINENLSTIDELRIDDDSMTMPDVKTEPDCLVDSVESLVILDEDTKSTTASNDNLLEQYDDLTDLLDKI